MELREKHSWAADHHRIGTASARGECTWGAPCSRPAAWSVLVNSAGRDSWWAACTAHATASAVLSPDTAH
ncbi:hypothetical protein [Streptomyces sp. NPDC093514]|uniref:hypothetical protein n=1 Tax=Streptomyces sp. NPDC093514 TaxID=3366039 RepID=UPI00382C213B